MSLFRALNADPVAESRYTLNDWANDQSFNFGGTSYPLNGGEYNDGTFLSMVQGVYKSNGIVAACMLFRQAIFSDVRFQFQRMQNGRPGDLFGDRELAVLEKPWPNAATSGLLTRMIQDADLAGNFYAVREGKRLRRLRPDWVDVVLSADPETAAESDILGYAYYPGGIRTDTANTRFYLVDEIVHWAPNPDPENQYRGMSWITPVIREILSDKAATAHKLKYFENSATVNTVVTVPAEMTPEQFRKFMQIFDEGHRGLNRAYRTAFLGGGAKMETIGTNDLRAIDFKAVQGAGETRIAAVSRVHPALVGLSEGLQGSTLNEGNFKSARRLAADSLFRPLWGSACAALESVLRVPAGARLWYDARDVSFLREDVTDLADIQSTEAGTMLKLINSGFEPDSVVSAIIAQDWKLLKHTGNLSVQLQPADPNQQPGADDAPEDNPPEDNPPEDNPPAGNPPSDTTDGN